MANSNQFNIEVGTILNTSDVPKQLKELNASLQKSTSTKIQYKLDDGQIVTAVKSVNTLKDAFGNLYKQIQITSNGMQLSNKIQSITESFKDANKEFVNTSKYTDIIRDKFGNLVTTITSVDENGQRIRTTIKEIDNGFGRVTKTTEVYNETLQKSISQHTESVNNQAKYLENLEKENKAKQEAEEKARRQTEAEKQNTKAKKDNTKASNDNVSANKKLGQSFSDIVAKVAKFYVATLPVQMMQKAITGTIETVKQFDDALVEFRKVSDLSGESLQNYINKLAELGKITGSTIKDMVEASTEFKKSSFTDEESATLANVAEIND